MWLQARRAEVSPTPPGEAAAPHGPPRPPPGGGASRSPFAPPCRGAGRGRWSGPSLFPFRFPRGRRARSGALASRGILEQGSLEILGIYGDDLDGGGSPRERGQKDRGRDPSVGEEGQPFDQFLVGLHGIAPGRQDLVDPAERKGSGEG